MLWSRGSFGRSHCYYFTRLAPEPNYLVSKGTYQKYRRCNTRISLYKIEPHFEDAIQASYPILCRNAEALEKVQNLALHFVKGLWHVPYEAELKQLHLFSLAHRRILGDLITMFKITHGLLVFPMASTPISSTSRDVVHTVANTLSAFGLPHFGTNYRLSYSTHRR